MDPKMQGRVTVVPYDPDWRAQFLAIRQMLMEALGDQVLGIEHVGSTSVEGLSAKPILDIDVVIAGYPCFAEVKRRLDGLGFDHIGNEGVEGREVFQRRFVDSFMAYHIYVTPVDSRPHTMHLAFRAHLRQHPAVARKYGEVKRAIAAEHPTSIDGYFRAKSPFVQGVLGDIVPVQFEQDTLTAAEYAAFQARMGWTVDPLPQIERAIRGSLLTLAVRRGGALIGMGRLVGDGAMYWYLQDVFLLSECQGMGLGAQIVRRLVAHVLRTGLPGAEVSIGLMAAAGKEGFYEKLGFVRRPDGPEGAGMAREMTIPLAEDAETLPPP